MSIQFTPDAPATRRVFNRLAREKMKLRLLADIRMDLMVCELEGWDKLDKMCDCWLMKRPYNCNFQQCPDMAAFTLLLLHIQQDQKRRKYYSQYLSLLQLSFNFNKAEARHDNNYCFAGND